MMTEEMEKEKKYDRLNARLSELYRINGDIAFLSFFINENEIDKDYESKLCAQLDAMVKYRDILEERIECGYY